jgi:hypothetical protein
MTRRTQHQQPPLLDNNNGTSNNNTTRATTTIGTQALKTRMRLEPSLRCVPGMFFVPFF